MRFIAVVKQSDLKSLRKIGASLLPELINKKDSMNNTALYYASQQGSLLMVSSIVSLGADINIKCERNSTALHAAFMSDNPDLVYYLINKGGDLTIFNDEYSTPLDYASDKLISILNINTKQSKGRVLDRSLLMSKFKHRNTHVKQRDKHSWEIDQSITNTESSEESVELSAYKSKELKDFGQLYSVDKLTSPGVIYEKGNTYGNIVKMYKRIKDDQYPPIRRICRSKSHYFGEQTGSFNKEMPKIKLWP